MQLDWIRRRLRITSKSSNFDPDGMMRAIALTSEGRAALARGHATDARQILKEKHTLVLTMWGESSVFAATSGIDLAEAYLACGETAEAEKLIEWVLSRYRILGVDDERLLRAELAWANCAYKAADYPVAEQRFLRLIERYRSGGPEQDIPRAMSQDYLAQVYLRQSRAHDAEPLLLDSLAIFEKDGSDPDATAVALSLLARLRYYKKSYREAEQLQRRAIAIYELSGNELNLAQELDHLGASLAMRARSEQRPELAAQAAQKGERAVAIFQKYLPPDHFSVQGSKQNLVAYKSLSVSIGKVFSKYERPGEAGPLNLPDGHPEAIIRTIERAYGHAGEHDYEEASKVARIARERSIHDFGAESSLANHAFSAVIFVLRRNCSFLLGEPAGKISPHDHLAVQMRAHHRRGISEDEATPIPQLDATRRLGVERLLRQGVELITSVCCIGSSSQATSHPKHISDLFRTDPGFSSDVLEILHCARWFGVTTSREAAEMAFEAMQLHAGGPAADALARAAKSNFADDSRRNLQERHRLAVLDRDALVRALVEAPDREAAVSAAERLNLLTGIETTIAELRCKLADVGDTVAMGASTPQSLPVVQSMLSVEEGVLTMLVGVRATFLLAITAYGQSFKRVEMEHGVVLAMCQSILGSTTLEEGEGVPVFDLNNALAIHDLILDPVRELLGTTSHIMFVPDGPLWAIPLQCLVTGPVDAWETEGLTPEESRDDADPRSESRDGAADEDGISSSSQRFHKRLISFGSWVRSRTASDALSTITERRLWVADRYAISVMPSFAPLLQRKLNVGVRDLRRPFLGIGAPTHDRGHCSGIAPVPEARNILTKFAAALGADPDEDIISGDAATLDRLVDLSESGELASRRVLCFATHATYSDDADLLTEGGLVFSNGEVLTAFDVVGLRINAELVLLTACYTGAPSGRSVTVPLSGLAQAFLNAGARCLLVSHWPVDAAATELFAARFAVEMITNISLAAALRAAADHVRRESHYAQPTFWSGFSIVGDGSKIISTSI